MSAEEWLRLLAEQDSTTAARWGDQGKTKAPRHEGRRVAVPVDRQEQMG